MNCDVILRVIALERISLSPIEGGLVAFEVPGESAVQVSERLRSASSETKAYPIIVGSGGSLRSFQASWPSRVASAPAVLDSGPFVDVKLWIEAKLAEVALELGDEEDLSSLIPRGPWPSELKLSPDYVSVRSSSGVRYLGSVGMLMVPTTDPGAVPVKLAYGGWNECPLPEVHGAFFRYWAQCYGAEPVAMTEDVVEMAVARPPVTQEQAIDLAREQYVYCPDIVDQGTETIDRLAAEILNQPRWFFWWD